MFVSNFASSHLPDRIVMNFGYDTKGSHSELFLPTLRKEAFRNSFMFMGA